MKGPLEELPIELEQGDLVTRYAEWGDMAVRYARVPAGTDMGPVLEGLPDDRCPSPHWGVVLEGSITLAHADGTEETTRAGEAYYWPAGHTRGPTRRPPSWRSAPSRRCASSATTPRPSSAEPSPTVQARSCS